jgi:hypothetical protein
LVTQRKPDKPGGKLSKDFMKELAVGVGAGLIFVPCCRTDLAFPFVKPF